MFVTILKTRAQSRKNIINIYKSIFFLSIKAHLNHPCTDKKNVNAQNDNNCEYAQT